MRILLALGLALIFPTAAFAHPDPTGSLGLIHGFAHPLGGNDHVLAMLAVGVFAYVLGGRALFLVPLSFLAMMLVGFALGVSGLDLPMVEVAIAASSIVIGAAAALGRPMPIAGAMALVGSFAIFHGQAHGAEMPANTAGILYASGFVGATALLHASGFLAAAGINQILGKHGKLIAQVAGGAFALGGVGVLLGWL
ncbi:HupE/UreJ family protein [Devosia rhodophyticola]|uniref:HupE/UreJ family protein n=1 Tax=Devosia rhodophyticola TaxID=3026423 RepID=A0ABY7YUU2_9HYPH|nr:HupE/UreJ family protein [Devosia rhodophyticola]WDR05069.1 HupE/UreJ family protein [Devosia rhodophyticola]